MKAIKRLLLLSFSLLTFTSIGQYGEIEINNFYDDCDFLVAEFYRADSSFYLNCEIDNYYAHKDSIPVGYYTLKIYCDEELKQSYNQIQIRENETVVIDLNELYTYSNDYYQPFVDYSIAGLYTPTQLTGSPFIKQSFEFKYCAIPYFGISKTFDIGVNFGFDYRYIQFSKDSSFTSLEGIKNERYSNINFVIGPNFRIGKVDDYFYNGVVVNFGAYYNLPVFNRYIFNLGNTKVSEKRIHNFQDLSFYLRLGYQVVSFHGEYRPFTIIKNGYPDQPKFKLGIAVQIPAN